MEERSREEVKYLSPFNLEVSPYNVRANPEEGIEDLVKSIREVGILQPLIVRPIGPRKYEVIVGARRLYAARMLKLKRVPCIVRDVGDREALILSLAENLQRGSLTQAEIQKAVIRLHRDFNMPPDLIAKRLGIAVGFVMDLIRIREAIKTIREKIGEEGTVVKKPGRYRQDRERAKKEVPITVMRGARDIAEVVERRTGLSADEIEKDLMSRVYDLKQKQIQYVKAIIKKELPQVIRELKEPERVKEYMFKRIEEVRKRIENRRQVVTLIDEAVLSEVRHLARKLGIDDDDVIEGALKFSLKMSDEFAKFLREEYRAV